MQPNLNIWTSWMHISLHDLFLIIILCPDVFVNVVIIHTLYKKHIYTLKLDIINLDAKTDNTFPTQKKKRTRSKYVWIYCKNHKQSVEYKILIRAIEQNSSPQAVAYKPAQPLNANIKCFTSKTHTHTHHLWNVIFFCKVYFFSN